MGAPATFTQLVLFVTAGWLALSVLMLPFLLLSSILTVVLWLLISTAAAHQLWLMLSAR
jgi:hypothetical protein